MYNWMGGFVFSLDTKLSFLYCNLFLRKEREAKLYLSLVRNQCSHCILPWTVFIDPLYGLWLWLLNYSRRVLENNLGKEYNLEIFWLVWLRKKWALKPSFSSMAVCIYSNVSGLKIFLTCISFCFLSSCWQLMLKPAWLHFMCNVNSFVGPQW